MRTSYLTKRRVAAAAAGAPERAAKRDQKRVLSAYLRLSVDREGNKIGYEIQRAEIERWAEANGFTIGRWYQDKDITAADLSKVRPQFEEMMADVEAGLWGGIVVWRLDRLVRLIREFIRVSNVTDSAGAHIFSISGGQQVDTRTPWGRFIMWLLVLLADMEIHNMKVRNKAHQRAKAEAGRYKGGGPRPFGFVGPVRDEAGHIVNSGKIGIEHVPSEIKLLRQAAKRIAYENWGWSDVIADWHSRKPPIYGSTGAPWSVYALQRILTGPRAVGRREFLVEDPDTGEVTAQVAKAEWEPILDERTWVVLNSLLLPTSGYGPKEKYLLSGILRCGRCGRPLTGAKRKYKKAGQYTSTMTYRCKSGTRDKAQGACGQLSALAVDVERLVVAKVLTRLVRHAGEVVEVVTRDTAAATADAVHDEVMTIVAECDEQLKHLAARHGLLEFSYDEWMAARAPIEARKRAALARMERVSRAAATPLPPQGDRDTLLDWFENGLTLEQRRRLLQLHVADVRVLPTGRSGPRFNPERVQVRLANVS